MMTTLQNKEECGKGPKRIFAPPAQKSYSLLPCSPNSPKEETPGISSPETEARISLPKASLKKKEEKATMKNVPSREQEKKRKAQINKQAEKKEKEKSSLTNAEFEEIVQIVLQKSLQECLGMGSGLDFAETSCAQPVVSTQSDKEPGITASATDTDNANGEEVPHTQEISVSWEGEAAPEIRTSKLGQPDPAPSKKKSNRLTLSKRKKEAHEKVEKTQGGHEHRQEDRLKKTVQDHSQIRDQQKGEISGFGQCLVWVQCSFPNCGKWRRLCGNIDPSVLPDNWSCDQNTDVQYNRCDIPEETWTGLESDVAYASYIPGSIIWAKQYGYPWWPGMIESDPDLGEYFLFTSHLDSLPSKYHVTFFGETVSRAWIPVNMLKNFQELSLELSVMKKRRNDCSQKLGVALMMAQEAEQISIQERVNLFGFWSRFNGSNSNGERKDLQLSGLNSPGSCLEKKEKEEELEKEEGEKTDPILPIRKRVKIQTQKTKPRGLGGDAGTADGRGRTLQRKIMKRSLGRKSTAPPAPRMGRKEGQGNSDSDQPGPKKKFKAPQSKALAASFSEGKEVRTVPKNLGLSACKGACPSSAKEEPRHREPLTQEAGSVPLEDEASSDLDLEQLMEDVGRELGQSGELQHSNSDGEDFPVALFGK
ncbi:zinc finger CW-type and PWWP domain containing 1 [Homo sapiens]|uniref:Zinc finger CW-type PWWP domain protein 1 n=1 Tax=Homo sapiens TaxID=9606 RepID=ZCPW1_HUMAN|nr:zinc finger CW-type PWWP domain protein 1 isoform 1 [Homo sapiens]XP_047276508.1 zinc finger CW-type PWWP domain protein 1 isoform X4 [Homo sapiens]XP_054214519.1 zinc finger CW-type PWWP domain protein 1 isoform X4 [Homo sapiens]Q9H0M4.2 RecName: Full=Zinc finger CW-type PWWP domain protein 1 [Homo sapiens]EAW76541.1 zinc finger, CW type with PWWP domain 1, isoform CRA_d [Homo sapiens]KAI2547037.1 zinc finger CW-type and PWWP domain containing 1 [Homo sapiens]KAI4014964.1 zinc finger CW-t|eukprot:NP_060454.3 zinc finger CW-type PWWP domain protein 1 isoform 1 [Homo sapiens]